MGELVVQCLLSLNPEDATSWNEHLRRYCMPFDFCSNYKSLNGLRGKTKQSKEFKQFEAEHRWIAFTAKLEKWCLRVLNEMKLTPNKAFLYRLTESMQAMNVRNKQNMEELDEIKEDNEELQLMSNSSLLAN